MTATTKRQLDPSPCPPFPSATGRRGAQPSCQDGCRFSGPLAYGGEAAAAGGAQRGARPGASRRAPCPFLLSASGLSRQPARHRRVAPRALARYRRHRCLRRCPRQGSAGSGKEAGKAPASVGEEGRSGTGGGDESGASLAEACGDTRVTERQTRGQGHAACPPSSLRVARSGVGSKGGTEERGTSSSPRTNMEEAEGEQAG